MKKIRIQGAVDIVPGQGVNGIIPEGYEIYLLPKRGGRTKSREEKIG
jgi:hypothetical protein